MMNTDIVGNGTERDHGRSHVPDALDEPTPGTPVNLPHSCADETLREETRPSAGTIYKALADHQRVEAWHGQPMVGFLQAWAARFIGEFNLDIPEVIIAIDRLPCTRYGQFRVGHNGLGLRGEISLNARYLNGKRPLWEILGTLLHELLHGWQQAHGTVGKRNHHNRELREKARSLGLLIDKRGLTGYAANGLFKALLTSFGVPSPATESPIPERWPRGESKLKKWACKCPVNVRCAVELRARCLVCGEAFALAPVTKKTRVRATAP